MLALLVDARDAELAEICAEISAEFAEKDY
jgi:hypothetical protein